MPGLEAQTFKDFELIVVDDGGSTDGSVEYVRSRPLQAKLLRLTTSRGYAGACNAGLSEAKGELVGILGNDNRPEPTWLAELVRALDAHPEAAAVMSRSMEANYPGPCPFGSLSLLGHNKLLSTDWPVDRRPVPTFYPSGNALLCRRALLSRFFDESYSMYSEDVALGWGLRLQGRQVLFVPTSVTHHQGRQTTSRFPARRAFFQTRNRYLNLFLYYERATLVRLLPWIVADAIATLVSPKWPLSRLGALTWLAAHWLDVRRKRRAIQAQRKEPDRALFPYFAPPPRWLGAYLSLARVRNVGTAVGPPRKPTS